MQTELGQPKISRQNKGSYMTLAREIAPHLPLLRRYARALTGAQESGDAFVAAALEAIVARPDEFPSQLDARAELYQVFHRIWESANVELNGEAQETSYGARKAHERLRALAPLRGFGCGRGSGEHALIVTQAIELVTEQVRRRIKADMEIDPTLEMP